MDKNLNMFYNRESLPKWIKTDKIKFERCKQWEEFKFNDGWPFEMRLEIINRWDQILRNDLPSEQLENYIKESKSYKIRKIDKILEIFNRQSLLLEKKLYNHKMLIKKYIKEIKDIQLAFRKWELNDNLKEYEEKQQNIYKERQKNIIKQIDQYAIEYGLPTFSYVLTLTPEQVLKMDNNFVNIYKCDNVYAITYEDKLNNNAPVIQYCYTLDEAKLKAQEVLNEMTFKKNDDPVNTIKNQSPIINENISRFFNNNEDNYGNDDNDIF